VQQATAEAIERWHALTPEAGRQVVAWAAETVWRAWGRWRRRLGAGVVTVGHGPSEAADPAKPKRRRLRLRRPALLVVVEKRWRRRTTTERHDGRRQTSDADLAAGAVPPYVTLRPPKRFLFAGERPSQARGSVTLAVPTDVVELLKRARPQGGVRPQRLRVTGSKPRAETGTACVFVRDVRTDERFLLGCHHVLRRSIVTKDARPDAAARVFVTHSDDAATEIGVPVGHVTFCWTKKQNVDVALVRLNPGGTSWTASPEFRAYWRKVPADWARTGEDLDRRLARSAQRTLLHAADGTHVLTNPRRFFDYPVAYGRRRIPLAEVHLWDASPATEPGASGAPALHGDLFVGMHVAGDPGHALTLPPWLLLGPAIKPFRLDLAQPGT
jgi:hypothetical protein